MATAARAADGGGLIDRVDLGVDASERAHGLRAENAATVAGGLGEPARVLLPPTVADWRGGSIAFALQVDPDRPNYLTVRLWGGDRSEGLLILMCEGKQVGYRHLGDVDVLDVAVDAPATPGRFFYKTVPLPIELTRGKSTLNLEIRSTGKIWGYGNTFEQYQKPMTKPTRGIYGAYAHTDPCFVPPADERQGRFPADAPVRGGPGPEVIDAVKARVAKEVEGMLGGDRPLNQHQIWFLARAYHVKWTPAHASDVAVRRIADGIDALYVAYRANPKLVESGPAIYNGDWFGFGPAATAVSLLARPLASVVDRPVAGAGDVTRRAAWAEMFAASRDWRRTHRRQYTNQSMISDTYGLYQCNRAVAALDPARALPEAAARRYLYESAGIEPWLGSEGADGVPQRPLGDAFFQLTDKGLTKELGFVGYYGEVLDWMATMYDATRPTPGEPGDERLKAQLVKASHARLPFRHPEVDADGNRAMRAEAVVGWRDAGHYPADVTYAQRPTWDASAIEAAAATLDPAMVGAAQQMFADNQFFATVQGQLGEKSLRGTAGLLAIPDDYETLRSHAPTNRPLPMSPGQPDFAWADEEDGVLALKRGDEILYVSLYWRARYGINRLACVHHVTPRFDRVAVVRADARFTPSGMTYTRPDWTNFGFGNGGMRYPGDVRSAHAGEQLPIAEIPADIRFKPGDESVYAGKADFYTLRYGRYLIGMNASASRTFELAVPAGAGPARELIGGKDASPGSSLRVGPRSTVILDVGDAAAS